MNFELHGIALNWIELNWIFELNWIACLNWIENWIELNFWIELYWIELNWIVRWIWIEYMSSSCCFATFLFSTWFSSHCQRQPLSFPPGHFFLPWPGHLFLPWCHTYWALTITFARPTFANPWGTPVSAANTNSLIAALALNQWARPFKLMTPIAKVSFSNTFRYVCPLNRIWEGWASVRMEYLDAMA